MMNEIASDKRTNLSLGIAFLASLLTLFQTMLIILQGDGICLNDGCKIVDSLTTVPPVVFNFVGLLYFQAIFWGLLLEKKAPGLPLTLVRILGLAGMASEGVLIAFQFIISEAFCSYCLIIFTFIVVLNISFGFRQMASGIAVFSAVFIAIASLQFKTAESMENLALERGTYGTRIINPSDPKLYLFFSSTCPHCEKVIELLTTQPSCNIVFQPTDTIKEFAFPDLTLFPKYSPAENLNFLKAIGIEEIPVLMARDDSGIWILQGEQMIRTFLEQNCGVEPLQGAAQVEPVSGESSVLQQSTQADACSLISDCETPPSSNQSEQ